MFALPDFSRHNEQFDDRRQFQHGLADVQVFGGLLRGMRQRGGGVAVFYARCRANAQAANRYFTFARFR